MQADVLLNKTSCHAPAAHLQILHPPKPPTPCGVLERHLLVPSLMYIVVGGLSCTFLLYSLLFYLHRWHTSQKDPSMYHHSLQMKSFELLVALRELLIVPQLQNGSFSAVHLAIFTICILLAPKGAAVMGSHSVVRCSPPTIAFWYHAWPPKQTWQSDRPQSCSWLGYPFCGRGGCPPAYAFANPGMKPPQPSSVTNAMQMLGTFCSSSAACHADRLLECT